MPKAAVTQPPAAHTPVDQDGAPVPVITYWPPMPDGATSETPEAVTAERVGSIMVDLGDLRLAIYPSIARDEFEVSVVRKGGPRRTYLRIVDEAEWVNGKPSFLAGLE